MYGFLIARSQKNLASNSVDFIECYSKRTKDGCLATGVGTTQKIFRVPGSTSAFDTIPSLILGDSHKCLNSVSWWSDLQRQSFSQ